jgi:nitroreductase
MNALECIMTRRSVRRYFNKPVDDVVIGQIVRAGAAAPSAGNQQPWQFIVVKDRALLESIAKDHPYGKMLNEAAFAIVLCMDLKAKHYPDLAGDDCGAATQNMLLACHALGLGACWIGIHHSKERMAFLKDLLNIPDSHSAFSVISAGYTDMTGHDAERFKREMLHTDKW